MEKINKAEMCLMLSISVSDFQLRTTGDRIINIAFPHPDKGQGIKEGTQQTIPEIIFGSARVTREMSHRHLLDPPPLELYQGRQKTVGALEKGNPAGVISFHDF